MWHVGRRGSTVEILSKSGEVLATVGEERDSRINRKLANAQLMALAPDMLDLLITMKEYMSRGENVYDPVAEIINENLKDILERSYCEVREQEENHGGRDNYVRERCRREKLLRESKEEVLRCGEGG